MTGSAHSAMSVRMNLMKCNSKQILLVSDQPIVMYALKHLLDQEDDLCVCTECNSTTEVKKTLDNCHPDIAIVDISMNGSNGLEITKFIKASVPSLPILLFSRQDESLYAERALRAGARGYIMKHEPVETILYAIRKLIDGNVYLSKFLSNKMRHEQENGSANDIIDKFGIETLSDRELEIFEFIGRGQSSRDIAARLQLSIKTVETHRAHIKQKLKIENATELAHRAFHWVESGGTN